MHKMKAADKRNVERRLINRVPLLGILWLRNSKRSSMRDQNSKTLGQNLSRNKYVHRVACDVIVNSKTVDDLVIVNQLFIFGLHFSY